MQHVLCTACGLFIKENEERCPFCRVERKATVTPDIELLPRHSRATLYALTIAAGATLTDASAHAQNAPQPAPQQARPQVPPVAALYGVPPPRFIAPTPSPEPPVPPQMPVAPAYGVPAPRPMPPEFAVEVNEQPTRLNQQHVAVTLTGNVPAYQRCYETAQRSNPQLQNVQLQQRVRVRPNGQVQTATIVQPNGIPAALRTCVAQSTRRIRFNTVAGGDQFLFTLRLPFRP